MARLCMCHIVQVDTVVIAMSHLADCGYDSFDRLRCNRIVSSESTVSWNAAFNVSFELGTILLFRVLLLYSSEALRSIMHRSG